MQADLTATGPNGVTILVAEDSATQAEHMRLLLSGAGFSVIVARKGGHEALAMAREHRPALVISDIVMPEMDGYALCRAIKADAGIGGTPVLLVTELSSPADVLEGINAGADNFLVKPIEESHLLTRVRYLLANRRSGEAGETDGIEIELGGQRYAITAQRQQILDLLISTYDQAVALSDRLNLRQRELSHSYETLNALYDFAESLNRCGTEAEVAMTAIRKALRLPAVRASWMYLRDGQSFRLAGLRGLPFDIAMAAGPDQLCSCQQKLLLGDLEAARNITACERSMEAGGSAIAVHAAVPLSLDGELMGVMALAGPPAGFSEADLRAFTSVGQQIATALARARSVSDLEKKVADRTRALQDEVMERRTAEAATRRAGQRLLDAIESVSDGFALYDSDDRLRLFNARYRELHPQVADRMVPGARFEDLIEAGLDDSGETGPSRAAGVATRIDHHHRADGIPLIEKIGDRWLMLSERRTSEGGVVVVQTDVTDLRKADRAKDEFVSMVSHELRTPLTAIRGSLSILRSGSAGELPANARQLTEIAERNCGGLLRVIDDLLDVERIRSGKLRIDPARTGIREILERALETCRAYAEQYGVTVDFENRADGAELDADAGRIAQAVNNLLSNAVKFSPRGGTVTLTAERDGPALRISVADNGPGIPASFRNAIFKEFSQADSSATRQKGGTGLGLSIAKTIVEAHGGRIDYSTSDGEGTTFTIDLPLPRAEQAVRAAGAA